LFALGHSWPLLSALESLLGHSWLDLATSKGRFWALQKYFKRFLSNPSGEHSKRRPKAVQERSEKIPQNQIQQRWIASSLPCLSPSKLGAGGLAERTKSAAPWRLRQGAKRLKQSQCTPNFSELGELASPYPSTGLRESAAPPDLRNCFCDLQSCFCFWRPKSLSWALFGGFQALFGVFRLVLPTDFVKNRSRRAPKSDFRRSWLDFELILLPPTPVFHDLFILLPSTALTFSKKPRPTKKL